MVKKNLYIPVSMLGLLCVSSVEAKPQVKNEQPNVVFIYADDLGRGMLSHYGQRLISTPHIDRLFKEGTSFDYAYGCMYSAPARASMLTGYNDCRTGLWNISDGGMMMNADTPERLDSVERIVDARRVEPPAGDLFLPQVFQRAGYVTGQYGKLDWGFSATRAQLREHGWDEYAGYLDHQHAHRFYPHFLFENDTIVHFPENTHPTEGRGFEDETPENYKKRWNMEGKVVYSQDFLLERMLHFIRRHKDEKFFLFHSTQLPHGPVAIPAVHPSVKDRTGLTELEKEYASMVLKLDEHVGRILDELERQGILENTIVIFSSDNGHETYYTSGKRCNKSPLSDTEGRKFDAWDYPYRSDRTGDPFDGNDGFSGKKWMNWEGSVRVPLVFRWPGHIAGNKVSRQVVSNYDLFTTFADLLHVRLNSKKDGESLLPVLVKGKKNLPHKRFVFVASPQGPAVIADNHWKLRYNRSLKKYRLHYLPDDYREEKILNDQYPEMVELLKEQLKPYIH